MSIEGLVEPRFSGVADVITASLTAGTDLGAGVTVYVGGAPMVDARGGWADRHQTTPFGDPLLCVYSVGKAVTAALLMQAVSDGLLDYDAPVADVWPAFGAAGKDQITLGQALSHQGGVCAFIDPVDPALWLDWDACCDAIAALPPQWEVGTSGYHPQTIGFIAGEVLRRATGRSVGEHLEDIDGIHCGLSPADQAEVGRMTKPPRAPDLGPITPIKQAAFLSKWSAAAGVDRATWMSAQIPASNMHATSTGLAQLMGAFATGQWRDQSGRKSVTPAARDQALSERVQGDDLVLPFTLSWAAGVMRNTDHLLGPSPTAVGHYGFGGACVLADPVHEVAIAYVPNKMSPDLVADPRAINLINAVYAAL